MAKKATRRKTNEPVTRCAKCGSTKREPYRGEPRVIEQGGMHAGKAYTHVVFRNTACADCGQHRCDRSYETRSSDA